MTGNPIDPTVYGKLQDAVGTEFTGELIDTFLEDAPVMIADLKSALATEDADQFRRAAHSIKANANTFGAHDLAEPARQLELGGLGGNRAQVQTLMNRLDAEYARAATALKDLKDD